MNDELNKLPFDLPKSKETGSNQALPIGKGKGMCASFYSKDDLDKKAVEFAKEIFNKDKKLKAVDLGCSPYFPQSIRFAKLGMGVDSFDIVPPVKEFNEINKRLDNLIHYQTIDVSLLNNLDSKYGIIYANRFFAHLPFRKAWTVIDLFHEALVKEGRMYFSFSSIDSSIAENYPDKEKKVEDRYAKVINNRTIQNEITDPMCFYSRDDIEKKLFKGFDLNIIELFESKSGSIKIILEKL